MTDTLENDFRKHHVSITTTCNRNGGFDYVIWSRGGEKIAHGWSAGKRSDALDTARQHIRERGWIEVDAP
jgi:hypothetical protein